MGFVPRWALCRTLGRRVKTDGIRLAPPSAKRLAERVVELVPPDLQGIAHLPAAAQLQHGQPEAVTLHRVRPLRRLGIVAGRGGQDDPPLTDPFNQSLGGAAFPLAHLGGTVQAPGQQAPVLLVEVHHEPGPGAVRLAEMGQLEDDLLARLGDGEQPTGRRPMHLRQSAGVVEHAL